MKRPVCFLTSLLFVLLPASGQGFNLYSDPETESSELYSSGNPYQKDVLLFYSMLEETHPHFADSRRAKALEREKMKSFRWAEDCTSASGLGTYIQSRLAILEDGHTTVAPSYRTDQIYPINLYFLNDSEVYVKGIAAEYSEFLGKRLKCMNGMKIKDVLDSFRGKMSSDNENRFIRDVGNIMQFFQNWEDLPYMAADSSLNLVFTDMTSLKIYPCDIRGTEIEWAYDMAGKGITAPKKALFYYEIPEDKQLCYLQFNAFTDRNTELQRVAASMPAGQEIPANVMARLDMLPRFNVFLEEMFRDISANGVKTLVVDLRNNKGGNSILGDILLSWLKPAAQTADYRSYTRLSPLWGMQYPSLMSQYRKAAQDRGETIDGDTLYNGKYLTSLSGAPESPDTLFRLNCTTDTFNGDVIFIQGRDTYSSAGMLLTKARDNGIGLIIGEESSFRPDTYGDLLTWMLPNTGIRGYVSSKYFQRPAGDREHGNALVPDVLITPSWDDFMSGKDPAWEWIENNKDK